MKDVLDKWGMAPIELITDPDIKLNMLKVYIVLASFQGTNDDCFPSREAIADRAKMTVSAVSEAITSLVNAGWIVRIQRGLGHSNVYKVFIHKQETPDIRKTQISGNSGPRCPETPEPRCLESPDILPYIENTTCKTPLIFAEPTVPADEKDSKRFKKEIKEAFETQGKFANYAREGAAIKRIEQLARQDFGESWELYGKKMVAEFWRLREQDPFMGKQPFLPSVLSSGGIWPRVKMGLEKELKEAQEYARLEKIYLAKK